MKKLEDMTYDELVDDATRECHSALLKDGGKGLKSSIWMWLQTAINWREMQNNKTQKKT